MKKIGILLDALELKRWQKKIISFIEKQPLLKLEILIVNNNESSSRNSKFVYRLFQAVDRKIFKVTHDAFSIEDYKPNPAISIKYINGIETPFSYKFPEEDVQEIENLNLDVLIRFGFGILKGDILKVAKNGVWSLHHGNNKINRGGPPGFWEIVNREAVTGATLQVLSSDLDVGKVISKSFSKTNFTSFNRNKNEVFWSGVELFIHSLYKLAHNNLTFEDSTRKKGLNLYSRPLYKDPGNFSALNIHLHFWVRRFKEFLNEFLTPPQWFLMYKFRKKDEIEKSIFRYKKLVPPKGYDWADPFVVLENSLLYVFFEELYINSGKAHISCFIFDSSGVLLEKAPKKVLQEEFHLSYPFVFKEKGGYYMLPESAASEELWIYEALEFPYNWVKKKQIFENKSIYDASIIKHNNMWYLFGTEKVIDESSSNQYLFIYFTKDVFADVWEPHPENPVCRDVRLSRPAGNFFTHKGMLIRPTQIGAPKYGYGIQFNEIKVLSPNEFKEKKIDSILPVWEKKLLATHTFNSAGGLTLIDAQRKIKT